MVSILAIAAMGCFATQARRDRSERYVESVSVSKALNYIKHRK